MSYLRPPEYSKDELFVFDAIRNIVWIEAYKPATKVAYSKLPFINQFREQLKAHDMYSFIVSQVLRTKNIWLRLELDQVPHAQSVPIKWSAPEALKTTTKSVIGLGTAAVVASSSLRKGIVRTTQPNLPIQ
jgi:hypothetical protein